MYSSRSRWLVALVFVTVGCSSSGSEGDGTGVDAGETCAIDYSAVEPSGATVSFAGEVAPLLQANCSLPTCHKAGTSVGGFDTGPTVLDAPVLPQPEIDALHQRLMVTPFATPTVPYVRPSRPGESFLMLKLDGCQDSSGLDCSALGGTCGNQMPRNAEPLEEEKLAIVRVWIAQGAQNN